MSGTEWDKCEKQRFPFEWVDTQVVLGTQTEVGKIFWQQQTFRDLPFLNLPILPGFL